MKKLLLSLALVAGLGLAAHAQTEGAVKKISIGGEVGLPSQKWFRDYMMVGASLQYEQPVAKSFNLTFLAGYTNMFDTEKNSSDNIDYIPLKAGGKYYFGGNFYGAGEIGIVFQTGNGPGPAFSFAPTLGAAFSIAEKTSLDFGLRYETWSAQGSGSFVGLRAAFAFGY
ncbi:hypothetical protein [Pedobacter sp. UC225_65]|uniref:hypothetical protein n=1 Tax=Pedobacter sp. UC225_65 TaxID=3350173 RepID=UPI003670F7D4